MASVLWRNDLNRGTQASHIGGNSVQFSLNDAVYADTSGFLAIATTTSKVLGFSAQNVTCAAANQTASNPTRPLFLPYHGVHMLITADQAGAATDQDAYADLVTTTTGAQVLNLAAGATGQFYVHDFNPHRDGIVTATTDIVVSIAEPQELAFAQS